MDNTRPNDINAIMIQLDKWVEARGSGRYIPADFVTTADCDYSLPEDFGIQQVRDEIQDFILLILANKRIGKALEIGLGYFGSTHFLWRLIFSHIATIEYQKDRILVFRENYRKHLGSHLLSDGHSSFFFGLSSAPATALAVREQIGGQLLDMLFIDGDHRYEGVLTDWLLYNHLVAPGGIVAFHDAVAGMSGAGVPRFLEELSMGRIDGVKRDIKRIVHSRDCGIGYYLQS